MTLEIPEIVSEVHQQLGMLVQVMAYTLTSLDLYSTKCRGF